MESVPWESELTSQLQGQFGDNILECASYRDQKFIVVKPESAVPLVEYMKLHAGFDYLVDLTAAHWPKRDETQFDVIYILYSFSRNERVRVKTRIPDGYKPATVVFVHTTAN